MLKNVSYFLLICFALGCVKKVDPPIRNVQAKLVVDGGINTDTTTYKVRLSYTGAFINSGSNTIQYENNAQVTINDNSGNTTALQSIGNGYYATTNNNLIGEIGKSYQLKITLPNGEKYASTPEKILPKVAITAMDTVIKEGAYTLITPSFAKVYIKVNDPANTVNFYRWTGSGWHPRKATGVPCGFGCILGEYCLQFSESNEVYIKSDQGINGNQLLNQLVYKTPIYWYGKHYVDIAQYSITSEAFVFWKKLQEQATRTGTTTDPLPSAVEGNVYNVNNPNQLALGYFEASSISHTKFILSATSLTPVFLSETAGLFIKQGECYLIYPNAVDVIYIPNGWANAPIVNF